MATRIPIVNLPQQNTVRFRWDGMARYETVAFSGGAGGISVGNTLTQGGVTSVIVELAVSSGSLAGSDAAGTIRIASRSGGDYTAGGATTSGGGTLTLSGGQTVNEDDGTPIPPNWAEYIDRNAQVTGTPGVDFSLLIEGSYDGTNWVTCNDAVGAPLNFAATGIKQIQEVTPYMRPRIAGGEPGVTQVTVIIVARRERGGQGM